MRVVVELFKSLMVKLWQLWQEAEALKARKDSGLNEVNFALAHIKNATQYFIYSFLIFAFFLNCKRKK
jgi:hypothetical protein